MSLYRFRHGARRIPTKETQGPVPGDFSELCLALRGHEDTATQSTSGSVSGPNRSPVPARGTMEATYRSDPRPQTLRTPQESGPCVPAIPSHVPEPSRTDPAQIRNFCIIAHIDHGKSTLADRMLQLTGVVDQRQMRAQYLDRMDIERERGITIKSQAVRLPWAPTDGDGGGQGGTHILNMIDTPGHVDFTYEVSRSLAACEGTVLLVDAAQGIEAQPLANLYLAMENDLRIIPVLNKIDLPAAQPEKFSEELAKLIGVEPETVLRVSGKTGVGVGHLLDE